jgi:hypothetical protein
MKTFSWILLTLVAALLLLGGFASAYTSYFIDASRDLIVGETSLEEVAAGDAAVETALRGRRATAAAFSMGFAVLMLFVVLGPYRRGEKWAWWALLASVAVLSGAILLRTLVLVNPLGAGTGGGILLATVIALLLDLKRLR